MELIVTRNQRLAEQIFVMELSGDVGTLPPGSFVELAIPGLYLRRPFSVSRSENGSVTIIYKLVGKGTETMSHFPVGHPVDVLCGLGNGFDVTKARKKALLIGGGVGTAPLYQLSILLKEQKIETVACLGFNTLSEIFLQKELEENCKEVRVTTLDGTYGEKGFVTTQLTDIEYDYFYACGPLPMLKAVCELLPTQGQLSLEARMGCGYGVCMGCTIPTQLGPKRVCKEGPVFEKEELIW